MQTTIASHLHFLPRYSPHLNPIETLWNHLKTPLKKEIATTRESLLTKFKDVFLGVSSEICSNMFNFMRSHFDAVQNRTPLNELREEARQYFRQHFVLVEARESLVAPLSERVQGCTSPTSPTTRASGGRRMRRRT